MGVSDSEENYEENWKNLDKFYFVQNNIRIRTGVGRT